MSRRASGRTTPHPSTHPPNRSPPRYSISSVSHQVLYPLPITTLDLCDVICTRPSDWVVSWVCCSAGSQSPASFKMNPDTQVTTNAYELPLTAVNKMFPGSHCHTYHSSLNLNVIYRKTQGQLTFIRRLMTDFKHPAVLR